MMGDIDDILEDAGYKDESMSQLHNARAWALLTIDDEGELFVSKCLTKQIDKAAMATMLMTEYKETMSLISSDNNNEEEDDE